MSYASQIKSDISAQISGSTAQLKAELSALVRACGTLNIGSSGRLDLSLSTENKAVSELIQLLFDKLFGVRGQYASIAKESLNRHVIYRVVVGDVRAMLTELGVVDTKNYFFIIDDVPDFVFANTGNARAYIRGLFLGAGSISDPAKSYHLEFVVSSANFALQFVKLLSFFELSAKVLERKNHHVVYLKDANQIVDVLNIIGAHSHLLAYEATRVDKAMRNSVNRIVNCDTANLNKMMAAARRHIVAIEKIDKAIGLAALPDNLREIAELRLANREMTLLELGQMLLPPISKSGVNHRMKKLLQIADDIEIDQPKG